MFDDDEEEDDAQEVIVYDVEDDQDYYDEEEDDETPDPSIAAGLARGQEDRALVDQQARDYDEKKKQKRNEVIRLKQAVLSLKSSLVKKEAALHQLDIAVKKDSYLETRERVVRERTEDPEDPEELHDRIAKEELDEIIKRNDRERREEERAKVSREVDELKKTINESVRKIASIEQELLRS